MAARSWLPVAKGLSVMLGTDVEARMCRKLGAVGQHLDNVRELAAVAWIDRPGAVKAHHGLGRHARAEGGNEHDHQEREQCARPRPDQRGRDEQDQADAADQQERVPSVATLVGIVAIGVEERVHMCEWLRSAADGEERGRAKPRHFNMRASLRTFRNFDFQI